VPVRLRIGPELMLALAGLLAATVMVSWVAVAGLGAVNARTKRLYRQNILTTQATAELQAKLDDAAETALQLLLFERDADRVGLEASLRSQLLPAVDEQVEALRQSYAAEPDVEPAELDRLSDGWADFKRLVRTGLDPQDEAQEQAMTRQAVAIIDPIATQVAELAAHEVEHARESQEEAEATYPASRWRILGIAATAALVWLVIWLLLIRNLVPRVRGYSRFAAGVADGQPGGSSPCPGPTSWPSSGTPSTRWSGAGPGSAVTRRPRPSSPTPCSSARPSPRPTSSSSTTSSGPSPAAT
jgi:hypothetical protein